MSTANWGRTPLVLALAASCALLVAVGSATATAPSSNVSIVLTQDADTYETIDWSATGFISGSGTWDRGLIRFHGGKGTPIFAGTIQTTLTNGARTGSFKMNFQGVGSNATGEFSGTWQIGGGTGVYQGLHGTGTWREDDSHAGLFVFPCQGHVHVD